MAKMPTTDEWVEKIGNKVLNEYVYEGRTLKEWIDLMASGKSVILPYNGTNGDVIKTIYHPYAIKEHAFHVNVYLTEEEYCSGNETQFTTDWWNSPYKAGDTE